MKHQRSSMQDIKIFKKDKYMGKIKFIKYGFYISLILWTCGLVISMFIVQGTVARILFILIPFVIYIFFAISKGIIEDKKEKRWQ